MNWLIGGGLIFCNVLFVSLELWCWYLRINELLEHQRIQIRILEGILDELVAFRHERARNRKAA